MPSTSPENIDYADYTSGSKNVQNSNNPSNQPGSNSKFQNKSGQFQNPNAAAQKANFNQSSTQSQPAQGKSNLLLISIILVVLIFGGLGGYFLYATKLKTKDRDQSGTSTQTEVIKPQSGTEKTVSKPTETNDFRQLAAKRLEQLTNGVKLADIESTVEKVTTNEELATTAGANAVRQAPADSATNSGTNPSFRTGGLGGGLQMSPSQGILPQIGETSPLVLSESITNQNQIDAEKAKQLISEKDIKDDKIFYRETELLDDASEAGQNSYYFESRDDLQRTKPLVQRTWYSANFSKSVIMQDDKILDVHIAAPDYHLQYVGGDYAVKQNYSSTRYFSGLGYNSTTFYNPELALLKYLLSDEQGIKNLGEETRDNKKLQVFEIDPYSIQPIAASEEGQVADAKSAENSSSTTESSNTETQTTEASTEGSESISKPAIMPADPREQIKTKYYVDLDNFTLYITEQYQDKTLIFSSKNIDSKEYEQAKPEEYFGTQDLKDIEIRETEEKVYDSSNSGSQLTNFVKKYSFLLTDKVVKQRYIYASDYTVFEDTEYQNLTFNKDFNPRLSDEVIEYYKNRALAYADEGRENGASFNVHKEKTNYANVDESKIFDKKAIKIKVDDKEVAAETYKLNYAAESEDPNYQRYGQYLEFKLDEFWYVQSFYVDSEYSKGNPRELVTQYYTLPADEAQKIDESRQKRDAAQPSIQPTTLDKVVKEQRLLTGDLSSQKLALGNVWASAKENPDNACLDYIENAWFAKDCLLEANKGFRTTYYQEYTPETQEYNYLEIDVLNSKIVDLKLPELVEKVNAQNKQTGMQNQLKLNDLKDFLILSESFDGVIQTSPLHIFEKNGQTIIVHSNLGIAKIQEVVKNMETDKDMAILEQQAKDSNTVKIGPSVGFAGDGVSYAR